LTITSPTALSAALALSMLAACSGRPAGTEARTPPSTSTAARVASLPPAVSSVGPSGGETVTATVLETMNASNYTYVRVKTDSREVWAAASQFPVALGDKVVLSLEQPMENFHSQTLNRDFPLIYFVSRIAHEGDPSLPLMAVGHAAVQTSGTKAPPQTVTTVMEPAMGGTTVAEVWKTRAALAGKKVTVRGKVVKYNGGILGVNWMHLQDGTGSASDGSNDITVTSETDTKVGDVITVTGTVALNKDLGAGYNYPVIIERATVANR
jgi:hypothetical protein